VVVKKRQSKVALHVKIVASIARRITEVLLLHMLIVDRAGCKRPAIFKW
jgi:hypothetical protein